MCVEEYAYYVNKLRQNIGMEKWIWRQIVTSQTAHTKYKWLPYATEWNPSMKIFCVRHCVHWCIQDEVETVYFSVIKRNLEEQGECVDNIVNFAKYIEKKLLQVVFDSRFSDFSEEDRMLAFINPLSLNNCLGCLVICKWNVLN